MECCGSYWVEGTVCFYTLRPLSTSPLLAQSPEPWASASNMNWAVPTPAALLRWGDPMVSRPPTLAYQLPQSKPFPRPHPRWRKLWPTTSPVASKIREQISPDSIPAGEGGIPWKPGPTSSPRLSGSPTFNSSFPSSSSEVWIPLSVFSHVLFPKCPLPPPLLPKPSHDTTLDLQGQFILSN